MTKSLCVIAALGVASASGAEEFCDQVGHLAESAKSGFRDFQGAPDGKTSFATSFVLPGATRCYIYADDRSYWCTWEYSRFRSSKDVSGEAQGILDGLRGCFRNGYASSNDWTADAEGWGAGTLRVAEKTAAAKAEAVTVLEFYIKAALESDRTSVTLSVGQRSDYPRADLKP